MDIFINEYLTKPFYTRLTILLVGAILIYIVLRLVRAFALSRIDDNPGRYKTKKLLTFLTYLLVLLLATVVYREKLGGLTVAFGLAGAGIAFALQEVIVSVAGWIAIMIGGYFKTGDRIQLGGIKGDVMDIGILRTTVMEIGQWVDGDLYNGRMVYIGNSSVFKEPVFNYSGRFPYLWDEIKLPLQYVSDFEMTKEIFLKAANQVTKDYITDSKEIWDTLEGRYRLDNTPTEPMVSMTANNNCAEFTLRYVVSYKKRRSTRTELFSRIIKDIQATNGEVKFPSTTPSVAAAPDINVSAKQPVRES